MQHEYFIDNRNSEAGYILPVVILLTVSITMLALSIASYALTERKRAEYNLQKVEICNAFESGLLIAFERLLNDQSSWDGPGDPWFLPEEISVNGVKTHIRIIDEESRLNVNYLLLPSREINHPLMSCLERLIKGNLSPENQWLKGINKWIATHNCPILGLDAPSQILSPIMTPSLQKELTWTGTGRININTASSQLLTALKNKEFADHILQSRKNSPVKSLFSIENSDNLFRYILPVVDVKSSCFTITLRGENRFVTGYLEAVVYRSNDAVKILRYRKWWS